MPTRQTATFVWAAAAALLHASASEPPNVPFGEEVDASRHRVLYSASGTSYKITRPKKRPSGAPRPSTNGTITRLTCALGTIVVNGTTRCALNQDFRDINSALVDSDDGYEARLNPFNASNPARVEIDRRSITRSKGGAFVNYHFTQYLTGKRKVCWDACLVFNKTC